LSVVTAWLLLVLLHYFDPAGYGEWDLRGRPLIRTGMPVLIDEDLWFDDERGPHPSWCPTCPSVPSSLSSESAPAHLAHVSTLSGPGSNPYSDGFAGRPAERPVMLPRVPVSFRLPALASWAILFPLGS